MIKFVGVKLDIKTKNKIIQHVSISSSIHGILYIDRLKIEDYRQLFDFYFNGLSEKERIFFCPYPLFNPRPTSPEDLERAIKNWKNEDDWVFWKLAKENQIIGVALLKRYKTNRPTSGLAVHKKFQKKGLGQLLQTIINKQAKLLRIKKLTITLAQNNIASFRVHKKVGFKKTGRLIAHYTYIDGVKKIDRKDLEMVKLFNF